MRRIKANVLQQLGVGNHGDELEPFPVLYEFSGERYFYLADEEWRISAMETRPREDGELVTQTTLRRPLGVLSDSDVLHSERFISQAFEERPDKTCVVLQLSAVLEWPEERVRDYFDDVCPGWADVGLTAMDVVDFCRANERSCYVVADHRVIHAYVHEYSHKKAVAFAVVGRHAMFYSTARHLQNRAVHNVDVPVATRLAQNPRDRRVEVQTWREWNGQFTEPGHYYSSFLDDVRRQFLRSGRSPRVSLSGPFEASALTYVPTAVDRGPDSAEVEANADVADEDGEAGAEADTESAVSQSPGSVDRKSVV